MLTKIVNDVKYVNIPEKVPTLCTGCVGDKNHKLCKALMTETSCIEIGIWIKEDKND